MNALFFNALATLLAAVSFSVSGSDSLDDVIQAAINDAEIPFQLEVSCANAQRRRSLAVYRGRVGVLNRTHQVTLSADDRLTLLQLLHDAGFSSFEARYGEKKKATKEEAPLRVSCRVHLEIATQEKTSVQLFDGAPSTSLLGLADALIDVAAAHQDAGLQITSLADGLVKLSDTVLAPEVLQLRLVRLPEDASLGFILRIEGGDVSRQAYAPGDTVGDPTAQTLDACTSQKAIDALREASVWDLPRNLQRDGTTELDISVLGQKKSVIARSSYRHADDAAQIQFEELVSQLEDLPASCTP
ncbi:MAG: hypothetical protein AAGM16_14590 [Pseudomonadota bacterium]